MSNNLETQINEVKTVVARRRPPGDFWYPIEDNTLVVNSLTDILEFIYQKNGNTEFYISAKEGTVSVIYKEEIKVEKPIQKYSLYGEY